MTDSETVATGVANEEGDAERGSRGAGFPTLDLASAVKITHTAGGHGVDFSASAFAVYCGHQSSNSGPYRSKLAAFKDWGLATSKGGRVRLTELGKDVARSPEPTADLALLRRAFDSCKIFRRFYDDQAKGTPLKRDMLGRMAVLDHNVAAKSQDKFVTALVDSAATVGLATLDTDAGTVTFLSASSVAADALAPVAPAVGSAPPAAPAADARPSAPASPATPAPTPAPAAAAALSTSNAPLLLRQAWPTATGEVVLEVRSTQPLPASAFALVGEAVAAADALAASIGRETAPAVGPDRASPGQESPDAVPADPAAGDAS